MKRNSVEFGIKVADKTDQLVDLSSYIDTVNELNIEALLQEGHAFGDSWVKQVFTGIKQGQSVTVEGFYDDAVGGPNEVLNDIGATRQVEMNWGGTKKSTFDSIITNYVRQPVRGELTRFSCTLTPTGEITEL